MKKNNRVEMTLPADNTVACGFFCSTSHFCKLADIITGKRLGWLCRRDCENMIRDLGHQSFIKQLFTPLEERIDAGKKGTNVLKEIRKDIILLLFKHGYTRTDVSNIFKMSDSTLRLYEREAKAREMFGDD